MAAVPADIFLLDRLHLISAGFTVERHLIRESAGTYKSHAEVSIYINASSRVNASTP